MRQTREEQQLLVFFEICGEPKILDYVITYIGVLDKALLDLFLLPEIDHTDPERNTLLILRHCLNYIIYFSHSIPTPCPHTKLFFV